jgi:glycerophosphoryl diester phosphodiesterase
MLKEFTVAGLTLAFALSNSALAEDRDDRDEGDHHKHHKFQTSKSHKKGKKGLNVQLGPRPYFLVDNMEPSRLKRALQRCSEGPFYKTDFSIGHRGAPLQFPEHTVESYMAAARMGAGVLECDVTFTADRQLVCRHSQCDLHTTTNILLTPLADKCSKPFEPARIDAEGNPTAATATCCTSDITVDEFLTLKGKMDAANPAATTVEEYVGGTATWRTDLYAGTDKDNSWGTLLTHADSIELFKELGVKMTPELKSPSVPMPFEGHYTQEDYAQQMIDEYKVAGVRARNVYPQSFNLADVEYWIANERRFGKQAVFLDASYNLPAEDFNAFMGDRNALREYMSDKVNRGVQIIAPPMWMLLDLDAEKQIVPSLYAKEAKRAGLEIITWTFERTNLTDGAEGDWYHQSTAAAIAAPGDRMKTLHVLAKDVEVLGIFSDWPASVTYYANCMGLR